MHSKYHFLKFYVKLFSFNPGLPYQEEGKFSTSQMDAFPQSLRCAKVCSEHSFSHQPPDHAGYQERPVVPAHTCPAGSVALWDAFCAHYRGTKACSSEPFLRLTWAPWEQCFLVTHMPFFSFNLGETPLSSN